MAFWGLEVKPGKATPYVPPPEASKLHLSQACLSPASKSGQGAALLVLVGEGEPVAVCMLRNGGTESVGLDLIFDEYTEFSVQGAAAVHLSGYYMPEYEIEGNDDDDDDDPTGMGGQLLGYDDMGMPVFADQYDSEDDSDYETEDEEEDEGAAAVWQQFDGEGGSSSEDEEEDGQPRGRRVQIEEITEDGPGVGKARLALMGPKGKPAGKAGANGKAAAFDDSDVGASDEDDSEEGEEEDSDGEEGGSSEEEETELAPVAHAGDKRKAQQAKQAAQPTPKQAKPAEKTPQPAAKQQQQKASALAQQPKAGKAAATPSTAAKAVAATPASASKQPKVRKFPNGFEIEDVKMGAPDGKLAKAGKKVSVRYCGRLKSNGKVFDQTQGARTFSFRLGVGEVIKGWDRGVEGMRVGDKRKLVIPPQMAYGSQRVGNDIPPNSWLNFDVELVDVR